MSTPITGMLAGLVTGLVVGVLAVVYFALEVWLDRFCVIAAAMMTFQLLGSTIGATIGKPHQSD